LFHPNRIIALQFWEDRMKGDPGQRLSLDLT
jgi:hypothetical protein